MSGLVRILIRAKRAGGGWDVEVTGPDLVRHHRMDAVDDGAGGCFPAPAVDACRPTHPDHAGCLRGEAIRDAYEEVAIRREPSDPSLIARLGRHLFDALLGHEAWTAITDAAADKEARVVELALAWDPGDSDLHRMNWELLHDGRRFLVEGCGRADVAITRVVPVTHATLRELDGPPRVLFAIGAAATDPAVRPGAETIGLLSNVEREGHGIHPLILEKASPERLAAAIREFRPHAVHLICHGETRGGQSVMLLRPDEPDQHEPEPRDAAQLLQLLRVDGELPRLVVLSACESAGAARLLGGHQTAPLAAKLVEGGVPVVVGMAGQVSDVACRLFTRRFGTALVGGMPLVDASAEARRAGFAGGALTTSSVDWAFPAVFMAEAVDPARPLASAEADATTRLVNGWISSFGLDMKPVFCSRTEFLDACWRMLHGHRTQVLGVFVRGEGVRLGRTRLLRELAKLALRAGHVPLLIGTDRYQEPPRTLLDFRKSVETAVTMARHWLGLRQLPASQLGLLRAHDPAAPPDERLDPTIRALLEIPETDTERTKLALQADLARLAADARAAHPHIRSANGRVLLLLDGIDDAAVKLVESLHDQLLGDHGLGTAKEPVPVVLAFAYTGRDNLLRQIAERQSGKPWLEVRELRPFQPDGEDLLAYEQVMLHPFNPGALAGVSDLPWVFNRALRHEEWEERVAAARQVLKGNPAVFWDPVFYAFLAMARLARFIKEADDDHLLATFRKAERQP